jgi:hypothetical protein
MGELSRIGSLVIYLRFFDTKQPFEKIVPAM